MQSPEYNSQHANFEGEDAIRQTVSNAVDGLNPGLFQDSEATATELIRRLELGFNKEIGEDRRMRIREAVISILTTTPLNENVDVEELRGKIERTLAS